MGDEGRFCGIGYRYEGWSMAGKAFYGGLDMFLV